LAYSILHYFTGVNFGFRSISVIDNWPIVQSHQRLGVACVNSKRGTIPTGVGTSCIVPYERTKEREHRFENRPLQKGWQECRPWRAGLGLQNRVSRRLKAPLP
jgi:hypothetical protein